ncbi:uncharacterized protein LOC125372657 [Haliotis rufescens]|uniref:uncharacterized protein LOC125372657 n=1 Tax=Haliotis rufescens TaxID=6454 RepID=UPI00201E933D|nr:uncharacterized protein LOC125372657 [Haliotis rufescens]XP_048239140.1 uncharacterized protein LOC125372657 [Haliotis rufescens]
MTSGIEILMPSMRITKLEMKEEGYSKEDDSTRAANVYIDSFIVNTPTRSFKKKEVSIPIQNALKELPGEFSIRMYCFSRAVVSKWKKIVKGLTLGGATDHVDEDGSAAAAAADDDDDDGDDEEEDKEEEEEEQEDLYRDQFPRETHVDILIFLTTNIPHSPPDYTSFHPEIYALTSGNAYVILKENMCCREFPIKCAKRVLQPNLKALSSKQLTGPLSSQTITFKQNESTMVTFWDYLGQITTSYKMPLRDDASLYWFCLRTKKGKPRKASMTVGETYLRMSAEMSLKDIALLLYQLSRIARGEESKKYPSREQELDDTAFDVLYHVKIVKDKERIESFNNILMENIISHLSGQSKNLSLYLSHRDLKGWENANVFNLKNRRQLFHKWEGQPPNLVDLLQVVTNNTIPGHYRQIISTLSLQMCGSHEGYNRTNPLLKYIHGQITISGESLFCYGGKWLRIEYEYMASLEEQFSHLEQSHRLGGNVLVLPWLYSGHDWPEDAPKTKTNDNQKSTVFVTGATLVQWIEETFEKQLTLTDEKKKEKITRIVTFNNYLEGETNNQRKQILLFLRMHCQQAERHYNEGYILYDQLLPDTSGYLLGDRIFIFGQNIELYDILFYTPEKTYLIHVKEGFGNTTRDVCSQIRNSAEVVFKHWICNNSFDILKKYWSSVTGYTGLDKYRQVVRHRYLKMGQEKFIQLFNREEIVYVLANRDTKKTPSTMFPNVPYPKERLIAEFNWKTKEVVGELLRCQYLRRDDAVRICVTDKVFNTLEQAKKEIRLRTRAMAEKAFNILRETMSNHSSFIAKMEVVHLYSNFKRFVTPSKRLSLKMCSIRKNVLKQD